MRLWTSNGVLLETSNFPASHSRISSSGGSVPGLSPPGQPGHLCSYYDTKPVHFYFRHGGVLVLVVSPIPLAVIPA